MQTQRIVTEFRAPSTESRGKKKNRLSVFKFELVLLNQRNIFSGKCNYFETRSMKAACKILRTHSTQLCSVFSVTYFSLKFFIFGYLDISNLLDFQKQKTVGLIHITGQQKELGKATENISNSSSVMNTGNRKENTHNYKQNKTKKPTKQNKSPLFLFTIYQGKLQEMLI